MVFFHIAEEYDRWLMLYSKIEKKVGETPLREFQHATERLTMRDFRDKIVELINRTFMDEYENMN